MLSSLVPRLCSSGYKVRSTVIFKSRVRNFETFMVMVSNVCYIAQLIFCNA